MNPFKQLKKLWGAANQTGPQGVQGPAGVPLLRANPNDRPHPIKLRRRSFKQRFTDKRMQRGVERAKERKQRPRRMNWIWNSMMQGNLVAGRRREAQKKDREEGGHEHMAAFRRTLKGVRV